MYEAYDTDAATASELLFTAEIKYEDIRNRRVLDLGCGSGILAIGAALLGAENVVGIDINGDSVQAAVKNAGLAGVSVDLVQGDIEAVRGLFDVTVMNPPFGTRVKGSDIVFLSKALKVSKIVYTLHKSVERNRSFLRDKVEELGGKVDAIFKIRMELARTYNFHKKKHYPVEADLYRVISATNQTGGKSTGA